MSAVANLSTYDLTKGRIRLADDVRALPQQRHGELSYRLHAQSQNRSFEVGRAEYVLCSLLDGKRSLAEAITLSARELGADAFSEAEATAVCTWLLDHGLAVPVSEGGKRLAIAKTKEKFQASWNPFWTKIPLLRPDALLTTLLPYCSWLCTPFAVLLTGAVWLWAALRLAGRWEEFASSAHQLLIPSQWIWLGVVWLVLKLVHEFAHGIVCKKHGGQVDEMGLIMILFAPLAYVDVTSSWQFRSRWQRIQVAAAGMFVEVMIAGLAALAWTYVASEITRQLLYNVVLMAGISTLLFNANPLMRFDGYYIFSDALDEPNLYAQGTRSVSQWLHRIFYGEATRSAVVERGWRRGLHLAYGVCAMLWRLLISISLIITSSVLLENAGVLLAVAGIVLWFGMPLARTLMNWGKQLRHQPARALRAAILLGAFVAAWSALLFILPCPGSAHAPGVVEYTDLSVIRAGAPGFVRQVHVSGGQTVHAGDLLIELENEQLAVDFAELKSQLAQSQTRQRTLKSQGEIAGAQVEERNQQALRERLQETQTQLDKLTVRATADGQVVGRRLETLVGQYLEEGAEILAIGREQQKEFQVSVGEDMHDVATSVVGATRKLRIYGAGVTVGEVTEISPRASTTPPQAALCAHLGGPLPVVQKRPSDAERERFEFPQPRFLVTVTFSPEAAAQLRAGQRGTLQLGFGTRPIATVLSHALQKWLREKIEAAQANTQL